MTDAKLLASKIDTSGLSQVRFALDVLAVDPSTVRRWLAGAPMPVNVVDWLKRADVSSDPERVRIDVLRP